MKQRLNYIFYAIALVLVLIPIGTEQAGNPIAPFAESLMLSAGILFLILGKLFTINQRRKECGQGGSLFIDAIIVICLCVMLVWIFIK